MTLADSLEEYGADAMRIAMADAGDGLEDANFVQTTANAEVLRLASELEWIDLVLKQHEERVIIQFVIPSSAHLGLQCAHQLMSDWSLHWYSSSMKGG